MMNNHDVHKTSYNDIDFYCDNNFLNIDDIIILNEEVDDENNKLVIIVLTTTILGDGVDFFYKSIIEVNKKYDKEKTDVVVFCQKRIMRIISGTIDHNILYLPYHSLRRGTDRNILRHLFAMKAGHPNIHPKVTPAEKRAMDLYFNSKSYEEIGSALKIKKGTVSIYKNKIIKRFGVFNELELFYKLKVIDEFKISDI
ncbi:LuxR C-terminal-related transcriptional regulator [Escherichia coli :H14]|nr:hypothetical protein [Escherichia coli]EKY5908427.1 hypothetical protein [Escherichia coli]EKY5937008.1 hypothetical protein [Escherichia coli]EKY5999910.1 hypothetical protein [Escherichia coli]EKY6078640.1 hypothetical protein [Escherichia coli]